MTKKQITTLAQQATEKAATYLESTDIDWLNAILDYAIEGDYSSAMMLASNRDTIIREAIPCSIWKLMGGELTRTGEANAKKEMAQFK